LQIPFFIAAYQFLEGFNPLAGVSFGLIKDLSLPDALLDSINLLPIAMTVVNLVTAYFYARNGNGSELKQMLVVAFLFLVLLYKLPSGLVLYWTMNNVFSFIRLFVTNPEVFKRSEVRKVKRRRILQELWGRLQLAIPKLKTTFAIVFFITLVVRLNAAFNYGTYSIVGSLLDVIVVSIAVIVTIAFLVAIHNRNVVIKGVYGKQLLINLWPNYRPMFIVFFYLP
jgi:hypothetical protein